MRRHVCDMYLGSLRKQNRSLKNWAQFSLKNILWKCIRFNWESLSSRHFDLASQKIWQKNSGFLALVVFSVGQDFEGIIKTQRYVVTRSLLFNTMLASNSGIISGSIYIVFVRGNPGKTGTNLLTAAVDCENSRWCTYEIQNSQPLLCKSIFSERLT